MTSLKKPYSNYSIKKKLVTIALKSTSNLIAIKTLIT